MIESIFFLERAKNVLFRAVQRIHVVHVGSRASDITIASIRVLFIPQAILILPSKMTQFNNILNQLTGLLADEHFKLEMSSYRRAYQRLKVRLRNNILTSKLKQIATLTRKFEAEFPSQLASNYGERIKTLSGKRRDNTLKSLYKFINQLIQFLDQIIEKTVLAYGYTQQHFKVGHLIHHLIFIRVSISRLRVCFKALLVYACDLMIDLSENLSINNSDDIKFSCDDIHAILIKNGCKPRLKQPKRLISEDEKKISEESPHEHISQTSSREEIGTLINRDSLKPELKESERPKKKIKRM